LSPRSTGSPITLLADISSLIFLDASLRMSSVAIIVRKVGVNINLMVTGQY
jgi:hypothetical protein